MMNERIRLLAEQAFKGLETDPVYATAMIYASKDLEKFAELIVRECAELSADNAGYNGLNIFDKILKHFGVEE
jgi:hypothetical protein